MFLLWSILGWYGIGWLLQYVAPRPWMRRWWERLHVRQARRLAQGFTRLAGVYVKIGQVLSVVGTFLPPQFSEALEALQDQVPPRPFEKILPRLIESFGDDALDHFASFERTPIAAASLAQVHRATSRDGRELAVKVLYPDIERTIRKDLGVLRTVVPVLQWIFPVANLGRVVDQLAAMLVHETDFANERRNLEAVRAMFRGRADVTVPELVEPLCGASVLSMSYEDGLRIADVAALDAAGIDRHKLASLLVETYVIMLMEHGSFHADPHPGNFLVRPGPELVLLDFGAVESVGSEMREGIKAAVMGIATHDSQLVLSGLERMGFVAPGGNRELLLEVSQSYLQLLGEFPITQFAQLDAERIRDLMGWQQLRGRMRTVMRSVEYPPGFFYVERAMILLFGLVGQLAPDRGLPGLILPYATQAIARHRQPLAEVS